MEWELNIAEDLAWEHHSLKEPLYPLNPFKSWSFSLQNNNPSWQHWTNPLFLYYYHLSELKNKKHRTEISLNLQTEGHFLPLFVLTEFWWRLMLWAGFEVEVEGQNIIDITPTDNPPPAFIYKICSWNARSKLML